MNGLRGTALGDRAFAFGPFKLYRTQKLLLENDRPVRLGSRALDILIALVERAGEMVGREELVAIVWPRTVVEESSLRVHVAALRKVLGDGQSGARYIVNQPGRGYSFVALVTRLQDERDQAPPPSLGADEERLERLPARPPARLMRMIGRDESVALLTAQLKFGRFVTVVGPGGIGKTTMALAVAEARGADFEHGVCFIDLAPVANGKLIPTLLMAGLGMTPREDGLGFLADHLRDRRMLLVFDNCEHVIDDVTPIVEQLLRHGPALHVLATSREPMRAEGEWLHRLGALTAPPAGDLAISAAQALRYPAIELFVERATASVDDFELEDRDAVLLAELCHRLDGNPLAIELAAARVDLFGLRGLSAELDAHVLQLKGIRRDAPMRHHSLSAMLEWSYQLLTDAERQILNQLSLFQGWFPLEAASEFVLAAEAPSALSQEDVFEAVANLTAKSLLTSDASGEVVRFRLLELTRAYALAQLDRLGVRAALSTRHATHTLRLVRRAVELWPASNRRDWFAANHWLVDEMRAALAWSFTAEGDVITGSALTVAMWSVINVVNPFDRVDAVERALAALARLPEPQPELEIRLNIALATKYELVEGRTAEASAANARALQLAERFDDPGFEAEILMAIVLILMAMGEYRQAVEACERLANCARRTGRAVLIVVADRIGAQTAHFAGANARCRMLAERVLSHPLPRGPLGTISAGLDHQISMRIVLARTLWIEGFPDQAANLAEETLALAEREDTLARTQTYSMCVCPIALWRGDPQAPMHIAAFRAVCNSNVSGGVWLPTSATIPWWLDASAEAVRSVLQRDHLMTVHGRHVTPEAAARAARGDAGWCAAEVLRVRGEQLLRDSGPGAGEIARRLFEQSLAVAVAQQALGWELRTATSLARWLQGEHREAEARAVLAPVYERFTEGFATADLRAAAALLDMQPAA